MKAIVYEEYGPPDVLQLKEVPKPTPKDNEVLIRVYATPVDYGDLVARNFANIRYRDFHMPALFLLPMRFVFGLRKPKKTILGSEFAGKIEAIGKDVKKFKKGDEVFAYPGMNMGANAEYKCMPEDKMIGIKPANMTYEEASCVPYGGIMALSHLRKVNIKKGQKVLINGASGGIGSMGLQLAKHYGAEVTGVCGTPRVEYVRSLGVDSVIDYTKEDFTKNGQTYDVIYDILGKSSFSRCKGSLTENGTYLLASFKMRKVFQMFRTKIVGKKKVICAIASEKQEDMTLLKELVEAGKIKTIIDRSFPLGQTAEAHRYVETGHKKGNVVITVVHNNK
jgi:NADPH:quinone reductase-like Zn-dependent oxidoreductase